MARRREIQTVMVVDDQESMLRAWERSAPSEVRVVTAKSAATARFVVERQPVDAALIDVFMLPESGIELTRWLRASGIEFPIILMSGHPTLGFDLRTAFDLASEALRAGANWVMDKPNRIDAEVLARLSPEFETPLAPRPIPTLGRVEYVHTEKVVRYCGGNKSKAARILDISPQGLREKRKKTPPRW